MVSRNSVCLFIDVASISFKKTHQDQIQSLKSHTAQKCKILRKIFDFKRKLEKIWTVDGYFNPQNDRVRAKCKEDVESVEREKFPEKRMVWLGMSARGLIYWFISKEA